MAWRDSRSSRRRLLLFSLSISLGIAALVAVGSLGQTVRRAISDQAKGLLGADLVLSSRVPTEPEHEALFEELPGETAYETSFSSMLRFVDADASRLVNVRALEGDFPFYGSLETDPPQAAQAFREGTGVLVEETLAQQFDVGVGSTVRLGEWETKILGTLRKVPGDSIAFATLAPRVYMAASSLPQTGLLRGASLARYRTLFRLPDDFPVDRWVRENKDRLRSMRLSSDTVEERKRDLGRSLDNLYAFLNLVAFVALLLGAVGIANAIHVHVRQRLPQVAILRCLGATLPSTFSIYLAQALILGLFGASVGVLLGTLVQQFLPMALAGLTPFPVSVEFSPMAAVRAAAIGLWVTLVFAMLPLLDVRLVSPLEAVRVEFSSTHQNKAWKDPARWFLVALIAVVILSFAILQTRDLKEGLGFAGGLAATFLLLGAVARGLTWLTRRLPLQILPFAFRQGFSNLHRPRNRTTTLMVTLGLGTFLLVTLQLVRTTLLTQLFPEHAEDQPNTILFDIQNDQHDTVVSLLEELNLPLLEEAPIVSMRLKSVRGESVTSLMAEDSQGIPRWVLNREYRSTWRRHPVDSERVIAGQFVSEWTDLTRSVPVSMETGIASDLKVGLGDELVFDVQGIDIPVQVASLREVEWRQLRPNFFVVFPAGILEDAPVMHVLATRTRDSTQAAQLQRTLAIQAPNVSAIDLTLVLETLNGILDKVGFAVRFMALFTVGTGFLVLAGAILTGRWARVQESALLRILGASGRQIRQVFLAEYACLGLIAALTGVVLAVVAAWALARFTLNIPFQLPWIDLIWPLLLVPALTVGIGLLTSRGITQHPPLEVLRGETG